ncbi:MAG: acyltransferase family protein, partial [Firmicutes bacterium]|nr:acyltransferase family protein [Bacillota bacterium]
FKALLHIFDFSANGYAWYIEMYIGLFIMIPFLNMFYKMLGGIRNKIIATSAIVVVTMLPAAFSSLGLSSFRLSFLPDYWEAMYPVGYYFLGMLVADIKPQIKKVYNIIALVIWAALLTAVCFILSHLSGQYAWWFANGFGCIYNAVTAMLIFILFYDIDFKEGRLSSIISMVSLCSMEAYLFSYITDKLLYNFLDLPMPLMTFLSLVMALICAYVLKKFTNPVVKILKEKYILLVTKKIKEPQ